MPRAAVLIPGIVLLFLMTSVTVIGQVVEVSITPSSGAPGEEIIIPIDIEQTTGRGVIAAELNIDYDSQVLSATGANLSGTIASDWFIQTNTTNSGQVIIRMAGVNPLNGSGHLVNVKFSVSATARIGSTYLLTFSKALLNEGVPNAATSPGIFTVAGIPEPRLDGDANGDDRVDHLDILKLIFAYNKSSGNSGYDPEADFDSDGDVDRQDMIILVGNYGAIKN